METWSVVFWGVVTFSLLVVIHEGGHFLAARAFGVKVHEFMIGLPGPAIRLRGKKTVFGITMVPLGGYVRIAGMEPGAEDPMLAQALAEATSVARIDSTALSEALRIPIERAQSLLVSLADWGAIEPAKDDKVSYLATMDARPGESAGQMLDRARSVTYRGRKTWQRIVILAMGVTMNILMAILVFTFVLSVYGYYQPTTTVDYVEPGSAAARAGVRAGDRLVEIAGDPVEVWQDLLTRVASSRAGEEISVTVLRGGERVELEAGMGEKDGRPYLGVGAKTDQIRPSAGRALVMSLQFTGMVFVAIVQFFNPSTFASSVGQAEGVVGIAYRSAEAASAGPLDYAALVALLSLSLGVMNILPIPPLDGGKVAMEIVERVAGRPLKREVSVGVTVAGALLLFSLIGYLMYADVVRYVFNG